MNDKLESVLAKAREDDEVLAVLVYGSVARGEPNRDVDVCIVLTPGTYTDLALSQKKLDYASTATEGVDVQVFQQLPTYIRGRVISEARVEYVSDEGVLFDVAVETHRMFEDYKPIYEEYLRGVADAG